ncbi:MAG: hypothetical protein UGF45_08155, partial [Massilioclostridium sp.]|nr:hypothetical protein [Massilioclostridium sp.]
SIYHIVRYGRILLAAQIALAVVKLKLSSVPKEQPHSLLRVRFELRNLLYLQHFIRFHGELCPFYSPHS